MIAADSIEANENAVAPISKRILAVLIDLLPLGVAFDLITTIESAIPFVIVLAWFFTRDYAAVALGNRIAGIEVVYLSGMPVRLYDVWVRNGWHGVPRALKHGAALLVGVPVAALGKTHPITAIVFAVFALLLAGIDLYLLTKTEHRRTIGDYSAGTIVRLKSL